MKENALVLAGGGIRGIAHLAFLKVLEENNIKFSCISGASAGAIIGAFIAQNFKAEEIFEIIKKIKFYSPGSFKLGTKGLVKPVFIEKYLKEYLKVELIEDLNIPLWISVTNINTGKAEYLNQGILSKALLASSAVPIVFEPVEINNHLYLDGGISDNFPIKPVVKSYNILGSSVNALNPNYNQISYPSLVERCFHIQLEQSLKAKSQKCELFFNPPNMGDYLMFDFKKLDKIYDYALDYARKSLTLSSH